MDPHRVQPEPDYLIYLKKQSDWAKIEALIIRAFPNYYRDKYTSSQSARSSVTVRRFAVRPRGSDHSYFEVFFIEGRDGSKIVQIFPSVDLDEPNRPISSDFRGRIESALKEFLLTQP